jgi:hypothetical protein
MVIASQQFLRELILLIDIDGLREDRHSGLAVKI